MLQQFIFAEQTIRQEARGEKLYISLTDCAKASNANRSKLSEILKSNRFKEYCETFEYMSEKSDIMTIDDKDIVIDELLLIITNADKINYDLDVGTWLDIASEDGQDILLFIAQMLSPVFHRQCNKFIRQFITEGYVINEKATSTQLAEAQQSLQKLQTKLSDTNKKLIRRKSEVKRLSNKLIQSETIIDEEAMNNALHALYAKLGYCRKSEQSFKTSLGIARFDSIGYGRNIVTIYEYKTHLIDYGIANYELLGDKQYFAKCKEIWPTKQIRFCFISNQIDESGLDLLVEHTKHIFGDTFRIEYCTLDRAYFKNMQRNFINRQIDNGLTFTEAERAWHASGCANLAERLLQR